MSRYWRLVTASVQRQLQEGPPAQVWVRPLGTGVRAWWARCDICAWSGPSFRFLVCKRGEEHADLCDTCGGLEELLEQLLADGWSIT